MQNMSLHVILDPMYKLFCGYTEVEPDFAEMSRKRDIRDQNVTDLVTAHQNQTSSFFSVVQPPLSVFGKLG